MVYGGTLPTLTASYSGFVNGDTSASLTTPPTLSTTATSASPVGSYKIDASGAVDPNYNISYVAGTLTIGLATLTWNGVSNGNWTDAQWSGANLVYPNSNVNAIVDTPNTVHVTSSQAANALQISNGGQVAVAAGASLSVTTGTSVTHGGTLNVDPNGAFITGGTLTLDTGSSLTGGPISAAAYQLNDGTASANLSGPGGLLKDTGGTVILSGSNSYAGGTVVNDGTLIATNTNALPDNMNLVVGAGGTFVFDPSRSASTVSAAGLAVPASGTTAASEISTPIIAANTLAKGPIGTTALSTLSAFSERQVRNLSQVPATSGIPMETPAVMSRTTIDAVFASHRLALDQSVSTAAVRQSAHPGAWLAAIESSWNSFDQNKMTDSTVTALDKVLAQYGV
jgi:autotransporter-associated beta strand protein